MNVENNLLTNIQSPKQVNTPKDPKLWQAVQDFKSIMIYQMIKSMRSAIPQSDLTESGPGKNIFMSLFDEEVAQKIAHQQNDSLSEKLYRQLSGDWIQPSEKPIPANPLKLEYFKRNPVNRMNRYQSIIEEASAKFNVDKNLISAVIMQESGVDPHAVSSKGAKGLMQLMPETAEDLKVVDVKNPRENIFGGTKYLRKLIDLYDGNISLALAGYNAGPGAVEKYNGIPPYSETQNYVKRVQKLYEKLKTI